MDIVERLRRMSPQLDMLQCEDVLQAADEIERLREENEYFRRLIQTNQLNALNDAFTRSALQQKRGGE